MKLHVHVISQICTDSCYRFVEIDTQYGRFQCSVVDLFPGASKIIEGFNGEMLLSVDTVHHLEVLGDARTFESWIWQEQETVSTHLIGFIEEVDDWDLIISVPEFGRVDVSLEKDFRVEVGQQVKIKGYLVGEVVE